MVDNRLINVGEECEEEGGASNSSRNIEEEDKEPAVPNEGNLKAKV